MKRTILTAALVAAALLSLAFVRQTARPQQWEYKHTCKFNEVQKLGLEGWEIAGIGGNDAVDCFYLKRAK